MSGHSAAKELTLDEEIAAAQDACRDALRAHYSDFAGTVPSLPKTPEGCFEVLHGIVNTPASLATIRGLAADVRQAGVTTPYALEHYLVLQAYLAALPRLKAQHDDERLHRQYCAACLRLTAPPKAQDHRFAFDSDPFQELARIVTLRRLHAGQLSFDVERRKLAWLLRWFLTAHPLDLPGLVRELVAGIGFVKPVVVPHLNYWRSNPLYMLKQEEERSLWRIARFMERNPQISGLLGMSWLYSANVGRDFPHLAWARAFFAERKGYIVELARALPEAGFLVGSERRRKLYVEGKFHPRETLVVWRRPDVLAWAESYGSPEQHHDPVRPHDGIDAAHDANAGPHAQWWLRNGQLTLIDCRRLLFFSRFWYLCAILLPPALIAAVVAGIVWSVGLGLIAFIAAFLFMWVFQYFFLQ